MFAARTLSLPRSHATAAAYVAAFSRPSLPAAQRPFSLSAARCAIDMAKVDTTERLAQLRKLMKDRNVDVYSSLPLLVCQSPMHS